MYRRNTYAKIVFSIEQTPSNGMKVRRHFLLALSTVEVTFNYGKKERRKIERSTTTMLLKSEFASRLHLCANKLLKKFAQTTSNRQKNEKIVNKILFLNFRKQKCCRHFNFGHLY